MLQQVFKRYVTVTTILLPIVGGCADSKSPDDVTTKSAAQTGDYSKNDDSKNNQNAIEEMTLRLVGEWSGGGAIIDQAALRRYAKTETTSADYPDPAKRAKAVEKSVSSYVALYKGMKYLLVFNKDGSYAKTSWGTGAYSDGKPQKGTWKITKVADGKADVTLTISGIAVPYIVEFPADGEFILRVSESMPRYNEFNRAVAERYKKKSKTPAKKPK